MPGDERFYFVLAQATNALRRASDARALAAAGITSAQAGALYAIRAGGRPSQRELGRTLGLGEAAITGLVGRLEHTGLVVREPDPDDRRVWRLSLSDDGRRALAAIEPSRVALNKQVARLLGDDAERVTAALKRLAHIDEPTATGSRSRLPSRRAQSRTRQPIPRQSPGQSWPSSFSRQPAQARQGRPPSSTGVQSPSPTVSPDSSLGRLGR